VRKIIFEQMYFEVQHITSFLGKRVLKIMYVNFFMFADILFFRLVNK